MKNGRWHWNWTSSKRLMRALRLPFRLPAYPVWETEPSSILCSESRYTRTGQELIPQSCRAKTWIQKCCKNIMVDNRGIEPRTPECKSGVFPLALVARTNGSGGQNCTDDLQLMKLVSYSFSTPQYGQTDRIWTCNLTVPNGALYQIELQSV